METDRTKEKTQKSKPHRRVLIGATRTILAGYIERESVTVIRSRLEWMYEVYGAGLTVDWPHGAPDGIWP